MFEAVAVTLWLTMDNLFYLSISPISAAALPWGWFSISENGNMQGSWCSWPWALYMFIYLGILSRENMQIEGFWYYLFLGVFEAATIHYVVAKIAGPLLFGRGWCGYACWTAMILDLLPYKTPAGRGESWDISGILPLASRCCLWAAVPAACPGSGKGYVLELSHRKCSVLRRWHCAGLRFQR